MNIKEDLINELSEFTISCRQTKSAWWRTRRIKKRQKAFFQETVSKTIIERDNQHAIKAVATFDIIKVDGKEVFVFWALWTKQGNMFTYLKKYKNKLKSLGFDVCLLRKDFSLCQL